MIHWQTLGAIGQLATGVVGIPSIIYLAVQVRRQTKERRQAAVYSLTEQWGDITDSLHDNAEFAEIFLCGVRSFNQLDPVSKVRFSSFFNRLLTFFESMYYSRQQRILTDASWGAVERTIEDLFSNKGVQEWWQLRRRWHTIQFAQVVDQVIARADKATAFTHYRASEQAVSQ
jgi:hypothetical protein